MSNGVPFMTEIWKPVIHQDFIATQIIDVGSDEIFQNGIVIDANYAE